MKMSAGYWLTLAGCGAILVVAWSLAVGGLAHVDQVRAARERASNAASADAERARVAKVRIKYAKALADCRQKGGDIIVLGWLFGGDPCGDVQRLEMANGWLRTGGEYNYAQ